MPKGKPAKRSLRKPVNPPAAARVVTLAMYDYHIAEDTGKHGLVGLFDTFWSKQFPTRVAFHLFVKLAGAPGRHKARVELRDKISGNRVLELPVYEFDLPDRPVAYDDLVSQLSLDLVGPGVLEWQVYVDGKLSGAYAFQVLLVD